MVLQFDPWQYFLTAEDLPSSDEMPVDNELQDLIPHLLKASLAIIWQNRADWFFGVDLAYYYDPAEPALVPDAFLSLGVERRKIRPKGRQGRLNYVLWEEQQVVPALVLECISQTYNGEYDRKKLEYAELGILYYVIYDGDRYYSHLGDPFEVYRLEEEIYVRQPGEPAWLSELGLGIGRAQGTYDGWTREWLYWYDEYEQRFLPPEERMEQAEQQAKQAQEQLEYFKTRLKQMGIEPEEL